MIVSSNVWEKISIYCLNHKEPVPMVIYSNMDKIKSPFYMCSEYENTKCANKVNLDDYQGVVLKFLEEIGNDEGFSDYNNYSFYYYNGRNKIYARVLVYSDTEIKIGLYNETLLGKRGAPK